MPRILVVLSQKGCWINLFLAAPWVWDKKSGENENEQILYIYEEKFKPVVALNTIQLCYQVI